MTATDVLVELHTLKPGPGLAVPAIIRGIEACMADRAAFTPDDLAAALQQLRHRCLPLPLMQGCLDISVQVAVCQGPHSRHCDTKHVP